MLNFTRIFCWISRMFSLNENFLAESINFCKWWLLERSLIFTFLTSWFWLTLFSNSILPSSSFCSVLELGVFFASSFLLQEKNRRKCNKTQIIKIWTTEIEHNSNNNNPEIELDQCYRYRERKRENERRRKRSNDAIKGTRADENRSNGRRKLWFFPSSPLSVFSLSGFLSFSSSPWISSPSSVYLLHVIPHIFTSCFSILSFVLFLLYFSLFLWYSRTEKQEKRRKNAIYS